MPRSLDASQFSCPGRSPSDVDEQRVRIFEDLRGSLDAEFLLDPLARAGYAADGGLSEIEPLGAIAPRSEADLIALVRYAAEAGLALHARGGGTGRSGGCLGPGIVVDLSRHLRRILAIEDATVRVEAGVVLAEVNRQLHPRGRRLAVSVDRSEVQTVGGAIASDAVGLQSAQAGGFAEHLIEARVVLADGTSCVLGPIDRAGSLGPEPGDAPLDLIRRLAMLAEFHADRLHREEPAWRWYRGGYSLQAALTPSGPLELQRLLVGSLGSLALITEATLRTVPIPKAQGVVVLPFARLRDAAEAVAWVAETDASACELFDWRTLSLARDADPAMRVGLPERAEAVLVVEFEADHSSTVAARIRQLGGRLDQRGRLVSEPLEILQRSEADRLLRLPRVVEPLLMRSRGQVFPMAVAEEIRIRPRRLPDLLELFRAQMQAHGVSGLLNAHATLASIELRAFVDLGDPESRHRFERLGAAVRAAVLDHGGTVSAGHDANRLAHLRQMQGEHWNLNRELKYAFDPQSRLNPGKVVQDESSSYTLTLRRIPPAPSPEPEAIRPVWDLGTASSALRWIERPRSEHVAACNSCGLCRSTEPRLRMCPTFRATHAEAASPRAQVGLLRQIASGQVDPTQWGTEEFKAHADLCVHCHLCTVECPSGIDVSTLMLEAKAAYVADHGLAPDDWMLSRIDLWASLASRFPIAFNTLMAGRWSRWLLERGFGLARYRRLPRVQRTSFVRRAERMGLTRPRPHLPGPRVAYFLDIFANHFDQELAESVVAVLQHAGVNVYVPKAQRGCGMPALVSGDLDRARDLVVANLKSLGNAVRQGYTIVCSEPTAALMLQREALKLTDDLDGALVAQNTMDVGQYLEGLASRGDLAAPGIAIPRRVGYHQPCHLRALGVGTPGLDLMRTIPGLEVELLDRGCSGMAGIYGMAARGFRNSLRSGRSLLRRLREPDLALGSTECSACRIQMEQSGAKHTLHPMKLLALGYGLNPGLKLYLEPPGTKP